MPPCTSVTVLMMDAPAAPQDRRNQQIKLLRGRLGKVGVHIGRVIVERIADLLLLDEELGAFGERARGATAEPNLGGLLIRIRERKKT
ncbi:hypothetical protein D9M69_697940 [compost metagenome]